jgi:hypothetical protein
LFQSPSMTSGEICRCMSSTTPAVAIALVLGKRSYNVPMPKKWSP